MGYNEAIFWRGVCAVEINLCIGRIKVRIIRIRGRDKIVTNLGLSQNQSTCMQVPNRRHVQCNPKIRWEYFDIQRQKYRKGDRHSKYETADLKVKQW